jgi:hypothetical protein
MNARPEHLLQDPLREITRKERRTLMGVGSAGIIVVLTGLRPSGISAFGITFDTNQYNWLLFMWGGLVIYFLVAFLIYAASDLIGWRFAMADARWKKEKEDYQSYSDNLKKDKEERGTKRSSFPTGEAWNSYMGDQKRYETVKRAEQDCQSYNTPSRVVSILRIAFDVGLPFLVGLVAIRLLLFS